MVYLPSLALKPHCINNVVHELSHVTFYIIDDVNVGVDCDNDEAFAYLIGYLAEQIYTKAGYENIEED